MPCPYAEKIKVSFASLEGVMGLDVYCKSAYIKVSSKSRPCLTDNYFECPFYPRKREAGPANRHPDVLGDFIIIDDLNAKLKDVAFLAEVALEGEVVDIISLKDVSKVNFVEIIDRHIDGDYIYAYMIPKSGGWRFRLLANVKNRTIGLLLEENGKVFEGEEAVDELLKKKGESATLTVVRKYEVRRSEVVEERLEAEELKVREPK
ncbi:MAG: hypothetical protein ACXQTI_07370 [Candidatus Nezhaarchaeales archaeon]